MARAAERAKAAEKHHARGQSLRPASITQGRRGVQMMRPEELGAPSSEGERRIAYTPSNAVMSPQQFAVYGRSRTETETINSTIAAARQDFLQWHWMHDSPRPVVAPLPTYPVKPFSLEERD